MISANKTTIDITKIVMQPATVTYLEMHEPQNFPSILPNTSFELLAKPVDVHEYRRLYYAVGEKYSWLDRMVMTDDDLSQRINAEHVDIFLFKINNQPAGLIELVNEKDFVEILYFGLMPGFVGKGYGKYFLQWAIAKAWSFDPKWIQLNTCSLDHSNALDTYKKAGFEIVRTETQQRRVLT